MLNVRSVFVGIAGACGLLFASGNVSAEYKLNLPLPVSPLTRDIFDLHMLTTWIATIIMVIIIAVVLFTILKFRKSRGYEPDQKFHTGFFGRFGWVFVPVIVLGIDMTIAGSAQSTLEKIEDYSDSDLTIKVVGSQWKWTYEYIDDGVGDAQDKDAALRIVSRLKELDVTDPLYLRDVDNPLVLPTGKRVRFLHTAADVLHAWWVPEIAYKKDSIPGYINETWTIIEKEGVYRGQCAENCGTGHAYMPIVVKAVNEKEYATWVAGQKVAMAASVAEASADKVWAMEDLMARGEQVYNTNCVACHMATGEGIPNVFPALKGGAIATGPIADHLNIVLKGKAGTAMAPWGGQLNDLEIAAVITYERNAWGNNTGDAVQPADVKAAR